MCEHWNEPVMSPRLWAQDQEAQRMAAQDREERLWGDLMDAVGEELQEAPEPVTARELYRLIHTRPWLAPVTLGRLVFMLNELDAQGDVVRIPQLTRGGHPLPAKFEAP